MRIHSRIGDFGRYCNKHYLYYTKLMSLTNPQGL
nr:MAG TPA: hypothetical protein [Caudoviricetes sp.]